MMFAILPMVPTPRMMLFDILAASIPKLGLNPLKIVCPQVPSELGSLIKI